MCPLACFEAGRFTAMQNSRTAVRCSRKWMSGHAIGLAHLRSDPKRPISASVTLPVIALRKILPLRPGRILFSLDKSLSWMSRLFSASPWRKQGTTRTQRDQARGSLIRRGVTFRPSPGFPSPGFPGEPALWSPGFHATPNEFAPGV